MPLNSPEITQPHVPIKDPDSGNNGMLHIDYSQMTQAEIDEAINVWEAARKLDLKRRESQQSLTQSFEGRSPLEPPWYQE